MHNLHYVIVSADSAEEACREVQEFAEDYGDENNWSSICGCVRIDNEDIHLTDDGRWSSESVFKLENIKKSLFDAIAPNKKLDIESTIETLRKMLTTPHEVGVAESWSVAYEVKEAQRKCEALNGSEIVNSEDIDLKDFELNTWNFDDFGLTNVIDDDEGEFLYIVGMDMHS